MTKKLDPKIQSDLNEKTSTLALYHLSSSLHRVQEENRAICEMAVRSILKALDCKDNYTYGHSLRVAQYCLVLGHHLGLSPEMLYELEVSALFHDVGKIGIPDKILSKPERLNQEEFEIMKKHPVLSYEILKGFKHFETIAINARHHHERFDGRGYPDGLKGEKIPLCSRIILISDTFDAITSSRVYRKGLDVQVAYQELMEFSGSQFDPHLVKNFIKAMIKYREKRENNSLLTMVLDVADTKKAA
jgi:HD-GYP domain-containing protein (c-di-GMP phosphodiesterase class II)